MIWCRFNVNFSCLMLLLLPLKFYDHDGRIKPPSWFFWLLAISCADWFISGGIVASGQYEQLLFSLFYPHPDYLLWWLSSCIPLSVCAGLIVFRYRLWAKAYFGWVRWLSILLLVGCLSQLWVAGNIILLTQGAFDFILAAKLINTLVLLTTWLRSRHLKLMRDDWLKEQPKSKV